MFAYIPYELSLVKSLLEYRVDFLNPLFIVANQLDTGGFYLLVAALIYSVFGPRLGKPFILLLACCFASNYGLKHLFLQPRPLVLEPSLALIKTHSQYGLPSGAAQAATAMAVFFNAHFKRRWLLWLSSAYVIFICISRVYLGMHFISDVVVGSLLGLLITVGFLRLSTVLSPSMFKHPLWGGLSLGIIFGASMSSMPYVYQASLGIVGGILLSHILFQARAYTPGWRPFVSIVFLVVAQYVNQILKWPPSIFFSLFVIGLGFICHVRLAPQFFKRSKSVI